MTALVKYDRLESPGLWRATVDARARDVVVSLRDATLVLSDPKSELALSHWSLPAVGRINPGGMPAVFAPAPEADETLEIDDADMIAALDAVHRALLRRRARPGRLRGLILTGATLLTLGVGGVWMPGALITHTASVLPAVSRADIGRAALAEVTRLTGPPCAGRLGTRAAATLAERLFAPEPAVILVLPDALQGALALPGGLILLGRDVVETPSEAEAAAGYALAAAVRAETADPMLALLHHVGLRATFRLLTTGQLPEAALAGYAEVLLRGPADPPGEALLQRFRAAGVPSSPYAYAVDPTGESVLALIEADPFRRDPDANPVLARPVLAEVDWTSLQAICDD